MPQVDILYTPMGDGSNLPELIVRADGRITAYKRSPFTGVWHGAVLPVTREQLSAWRSGGQLIQDAMPELDAGAREFLMTGITPAEWDAAFKEGSSC